MAVNSVPSVVSKQCKNKILIPTFFSDYSEFLRQNKKGWDLSKVWISDLMN
jgi:hypothetical protein